MGLSITTKSESETIAVAKKFLQKTLKETRPDSPLIFYLSGDLGVGKTHFVKGLAEGLGIKDNITSPTFVLMKKYAVPRDSETSLKGKTLFFHIDCYRIYDNEDARQIGLDTILENPRSIVAVEWAERIVDIIPKPYWKLTFQHISDTRRKIVIKNVQK